MDANAESFAFQQFNEQDVEKVTKAQEKEIAYLKRNIMVDVERHRNLAIAIKI
jgi:hypothetical protein